MSIDRYDLRMVRAIGGQEGQAARIKTTHSEKYTLISGDKGKPIYNMYGENHFCERVYDNGMFTISATTEQLGSEVQREATFIIIKKLPPKTVIIYPPEKTPFEFKAESLQVTNPLFPKKPPYIPTDPNVVREMISQNKIPGNLLSDQKITQLLNYVALINRV